MIPTGLEPRPSFWCIAGKGERVTRIARLSWVCVCFATASMASAQAAQLAPSAQAAPAAADRTDEAKGLFVAARAAFDAGRYTDALDYFERSFALSKRPELLYNIGIVRDRLRDDERALEAYDAYLAALPNAPNRVEVEKRAAAIRAALAARQAQSPAVASAPTPAQTAAAAAAPAANPALAPTDSNAEPAASASIVSRWWFWTAVGVVVAGGITAGVVVASSGTAKTEAPLMPKSGVVITTLRAAP